MKFKFFLFIISFILLDKFLIPNSERDDIREINLILKKIKNETLYNSNKNCYEYIENEPFFFQAQLNTEKYKVLIVKNDSKIPSFNEVLVYQANDTYKSFTKKIMEFYNLKKLLFEVNYIFIGCLNSKNLFVSIAPKYRKRAIINHIIK